MLTLRDAINIANVQGAGSPTITFDSTVFATAQTITLAQGPLTLSDTTGKVTIQGPAAGVSISGNNRSGVFVVNAGANAEFDNLIITHGAASKGGGVQNNGGNLTFNNVAFKGDSAIGAAAQPVASPSQLPKQSATAVANDGTIINFTYTIQKDDYIVPYGLGGGLYSSGGSINMIDCTFSSDTAQGGTGGNAGNESYSPLTRNNSGGYTQLVNFPFLGEGGGNGEGGGLMIEGGTATINSTTFTSCVAVGGQGGNGGSYASVGRGGVGNDFLGSLGDANGGVGGAGAGGGLAVSGTASVNVIGCTFNADGATGGAGGAGGSNPAGFTRHVPLSGGGRSRLLT